MIGKIGTILFLVMRDIAKRQLTFFLIILALSFTFLNLLVSNTFLRGMEQALIDGAIGTFNHIYISPPKIKLFCKKTKVNQKTRPFGRVFWLFSVNPCS
jgi:ABC-type lipoprotein release transport system permease subunit